jgi:hypothetical protein
VANDLYAVADFISDALDVDKTMTAEVLNAAPVVARIPISDTSDGGDTHSYSIYTGAPVVGFRAENAGRDYDHSVDEVVTVTCKILDFSYRVDYAIAQAWRQGPEDLIAREGVRHLGAALFATEQQIIYSTTSPGDSSGFSGFLTNTDYDALADDMVINAAGSTADIQSSVWAFKTGFNDVRLVTPFSRGITLGETIITEANDANYPVFYTPASLLIAVQMGGKYSAGRIANLNNGTDSKPLTDDLISSMLSEFPANMGPTFMAMNRTSLKDLQQSRTATTTSGAPAPFPQDSFGVPIVVTDAITQTEAVEA